MNEFSCWTHYVFQLFKDRDWQFWMQLFLLVATTGAFIAAAFYARIANHTLKQIQKQTASVENAANAAKMSAEIAEKTMVLTRRPWVSVHLEIKSDYTLDERGGHISILFKMSNIGNSPAVAVWVEAKAVGGTGSAVELLDEQQKMIDSAKKYANRNTTVPNLNSNSFGFMLFPGEAYYHTQHLTIAPEEIKKKASGETILPAIVGCVVYGFSFDESVHKTGFIEQLWQIITPEHIKQFPPELAEIFKSSQYLSETTTVNIPQSNLRLTNSFPIGGYAD